MAVALAASCSVREEPFGAPPQDEGRYYASIEQLSEGGTKVYANEDLLLRWTADDRVSIFGKNTYNQQYRFLGETGDNSGGFSKVDGAEYVTGNPIDHVISVYPYQSSTKVMENETLTVTLPAWQPYAENTFGLGANTMVSCSSDNFLLYKNVGGYLRLHLYGKDVSVHSIQLRGNKGEKLAGKATVSLSSDGTPSAVMAEDATSEITLICEPPVQLGATSDKSTAFWLVIPPMTFRNGFTVSITQLGGISEKATSKSITIDRNNVTKMSPLGVEKIQPNNVIFYTSTDGRVVTPYSTTAFGANIVSNEYIDGIGVITFDGDVTTVGPNAFYQRSTLATISLPGRVTSIDGYAYAGCTGLVDFFIPASVTTIGSNAFNACKSLTSIEIPRSVSNINVSAFAYCGELASIVVDPSNPVYDSRDNCNAIIETSTNSLVSGCKNTVIPEDIVAIEYGAFTGHGSLTSVIIPDGVTTIGGYAFYDCTGLTSIEVPAGITSIGAHAFQGCSRLSRITVFPATPPQGGTQMWDATNQAPIYVPSGSLEAYKSASFWSLYETRIQGFLTDGQTQPGGNEGVGYDYYN